MSYSSVDQTSLRAWNILNHASLWPGSISNVFLYACTPSSISPREVLHIPNKFHPCAFLPLILSALWASVTALLDNTPKSDPKFQPNCGKNANIWPIGTFGADALFTWSPSFSGIPMPFLWLGLRGLSYSESDLCIFGDLPSLLDGHQVHFWPGHAVSMCQDSLGIFL